MLDKSRFYTLDLYSNNWQDPFWASDFAEVEFLLLGEVD